MAPATESHNIQCSAFDFCHFLAKHDSMSRVYWSLTTILVLAGCAPQNTSEGIKQESPTGQSSRVESEDQKVQSNSPERKTVVTLTPAALEMVQNFLKQDPHPYLRVNVLEGVPTGYLYDLRFDDKIDPALDFVDDSHGIRIVVDRSSAAFLVGTSIDFEDSGAERGFRFHNPNAVEE